MDGRGRRTRDRSSVRKDRGYDVAALAKGLGRELRGKVLGDAARRALYARDESNHRVVPDLVVVPSDREELAIAVALAGAAGAPIVLRGAGTSMAGNAIGAVVIDTFRHVNRVIDVDPSSASRATIGGWSPTTHVAHSRSPTAPRRTTCSGWTSSCGRHTIARGSR